MRYLTKKEKLSKALTRERDRRGLSQQEVAIKPGGAWISPGGKTIGDVIPFAAYAYPTHSGDPEIDHVKRMDDLLLLAHLIGCGLNINASAFSGWSRRVIDHDGGPMGGSEITSCLSWPSRPLYTPG